MREAALLIVAIAAFIASAFVPGGAIDTATHPEQTAPPSETPSEQGSLAEPSPTPTFLAPGEIAVPRSPDGQFYAEVGVNDRPIRFLVDTGATMRAPQGYSGLRPTSKLSHKARAARSKACASRSIGSTSAIMKFEI